MPYLYIHPRAHQIPTEFIQAFQISPFNSPDRKSPFTCRAPVVEDDHDQCWLKHMAHNPSYTTDRYFVVHSPEIWLASNRRVAQ